ncbi:hypothetical protein QFZ27_001756 [Inquilinus ginsengisoli]|uniref:hypothetical protein n=1 Tax=Inquilinus ginsengisoli TaxID=363840 RepID=UPI003D191152
MSTIPPNANDIQITAGLIDDYLLTEDAPVGPNPNGRFVAVQDPGVATPSTSLLSVDSSGNMIHFYPDQTSHSGWSTTTIPVPAPSGAGGPIARLAAFAQDGITNALAYFPLPGASGNAATWMQSPAPGTWNRAPLTHDSANALGYTYQTDYYIDASGNQYLYGVTGNISGGAFFLVWFDADNGVWDVLYEQYLSTFDPVVSTGAAFRLMPGADGALNVLWIDGGVIYWQPASISDPGTSNAEFAWSGDVASFDPGLGALSISEILPLPGSAGQSNLLVVDATQTLYLIQGYDQGSGAAMTALTGPGGNQPAGAAGATVGADSQGNLMVLVTETTSQSLWILRQTGSENDVPTFAPWVPLGNTVTALAAPPSMAGGPELFLVDPGLSAYHMAQNLTDYVWSTRKIAAPTPSSGSPTNIAGTSMSLAVVDANQAPIADALVSVSSDQPVVIVASGVSYPVGPGAPAQIQADSTGQASIVVETTSLSMPPLTFTVTNADGSTAQRSCQGDQVQVKSGENPPPTAPSSVASRLSNNDPGQPLTVASLTSAGLINSGYSDPSDAVAAIQAAGQWLQQDGSTDLNTLSLGHVTVRHWRIEFPRTGSPRFMALTEAQAQAYLAKARTAAEPDSFLSFFGDVANFFKHAWQALESFTVTIADDLTIVFNDAEQFVVNTIREAGQALETIFSRIMAGLVEVYDEIKNVVNWLKQLFEWGDILNTHRVIKVMVTSGLDFVSGSIAAAESAVQAKFDTVKTQVATAFDNLETIFAQGQSFNDFANAAGQSPIGGSGNVLAAQPASTTYSQNGSRCSYVHNHVKSYYAGGGGGGGGSGSIQNISDLIQSSLTGDTFNTQTQAVQDFVSSQVTNLHQFFDLVVIDLLNAAKGLVLFVIDAVEDIVLAVLQALEDAINGLLASWSATIDIPIISWLYKYVITGSTENPGDDLTILDAFSLVLAVPGTILYKILVSNGAAPFTEADVESIEQNGLPWPQLGDTSMLRADTDSVPILTPTMIKVFGVLAGIANFFGAFCSGYSDYMAFQEAPDEDLKIFWSIMTLLTGLASQIGGAPWPLFVGGLHSPADDWTVAFWSVSWIPLISDLVFTFATGGLARFTDAVGPILDTAMGAVMVGLAVGVIIKQQQSKPPYTGWDQANAIVPQTGRLFKFLILAKDTEAAAIALPALLVIDLVLGLGSTVTQIGDAIVG